MLDAASYLKDAEVTFSLLPTIHRKNFRDIKSFLELAQEIGVPIAFSLLTCNSYETKLRDYVLTEQEFRDFINQNRGNEDFHINESPINIDDIVFKTTCGAGKSTISIDAEGNVYPCHMLHSKELCMGNILIDKWNTIFDGKKGHDLIDFDVDIIDECFKCEYKYFCGGGCKARTLYAKKTLNAPDIYCMGLKDIYKDLADFFAELAENID